MSAKMGPVTFCCKSSSNATKIVAIIDMCIFSIFFLLLTFLSIVYAASIETFQIVLTPFSEDVGKFLKLGGLIKLWIILSFLFWCLAEIGLSFLLYYGTQRRSYGMLRTWIFAIIVDSLFAMMVFIQLIVSTTYFLLYIFLAVLYYGYRILALWIVHLLLREIMEQVEWV